GLSLVPRLRGKARDARGVTFGGGVQLFANRRRLAVAFFFPKADFCTVTFLVVADHEPPQKIVERLMLKSVLRGSDAKRDVIETRESPRVTNPTRQERNHRRRVVVCRQRSAITKRDFHIRRRQRTSEHFCDAAVGSVRRD